ncbi:MAG: hypothetical protein H7Z38_08880 [Rubrivivax sp.]|nr:hypothetical protein [Pyrinomonadaceae bacterium]
MSTEERVAQLESAFVTLTRLVQSHGERFDTHMGWINQLGAAQAELTAAQADLAAAQANSEQKIAALVDAQIHTEEVVASTNERIDRLIEQAAQTNARLDRLAELVERLAEGGRGGET